MRYLILLLLPAIIIISGCQKQIEETKVENIIDDVIVINNIMKNNIIEYKNKNSINLTKEDVDNITNSINRAVNNIKELQELEKALNNEELYNAVKLNSAVELMMISLYGDNSLEENTAQYLMTLNLYVKELISLANAGVDINEYVTSYKNKDEVNAYFLENNAIKMAQYRLVAKTINLVEEDKLIYNKIQDINTALLSTYNLYSNDLSHKLYNELQNIFKDKLFLKPVSNAGVGFIDRLINYKIIKAIESLNDEYVYYTILYTESKYFKDYVEIIQGRPVDSSDYSILARERNNVKYIICSHPKYLGSETNAFCLDFINNVDMKDIEAELSDKNVMDNKKYIMIDDELCMIDDNNKINFYSKNKLCKAIKSKN